MSNRFEAVVFKAAEVLNKRYWYTYYEGKFWCVPGEFMKDNKITDYDAVFQVRTSALVGMSATVKQAQVARMCHLFPELTLEQVKQALAR